MDEVDTVVDAVVDHVAVVVEAAVEAVANIAEKRYKNIKNLLRVPHIRWLLNVLRKLQRKMLKPENTQVALMLQIKDAEGGATISMVPAAKSMKFDEDPVATREAQFSYLLGKLKAKKNALKNKSGR